MRSFRDLSSASRAARSASHRPPAGSASALLEADTRDDRPYRSIRDTGLGGGAALAGATGTRAAGRRWSGTMNVGGGWGGCEHSTRRARGEDSSSTHCRQAAAVEDDLARRLGVARARERVDYGVYGDVGEGGVDRLDLGGVSSAGDTHTTLCNAPSRAVRRGTRRLGPLPGLAMSRSKQAPPTRSSQPAVQAVHDRDEDERREHVFRGHGGGGVSCEGVWWWGGLDREGGYVGGLLAAAMAEAENGAPGGRERSSAVVVVNV